jgi:hypothetical protein
MYNNFISYPGMMSSVGEPWLSEQKNGLKINEKPKDPKLSHCP